MCAPGGVGEEKVLGSTILDLSRARTTLSKRKNPDSSQLSANRQLCLGVLGATEMRYRNSSGELQSMLINTAYPRQSSEQTPGSTFFLQHS